jgi:hypothetical protein
VATDEEFHYAGDGKVCIHFYWYFCSNLLNLLKIINKKETKFSVF